MKKIFYKVLNRDQRKIFPQLKFLDAEGFYLAGGTGLALQLGHRTSLDFDFYNRDHFSPDEIFAKLEKNFPGKVVEISKAEDTLLVRISKTSASFFYYEYPLVYPLRETEGPLLASLEDIGAMKLAALVGRAKKRDYIDIYYLIKVLGLSKMLAVAEKKYPSLNLYFVRRALSFFADVEEEEGRIEVFDKNFSWEKAKKEIFAEVRKYQLGMIKGG